MNTIAKPAASVVVLHEFAGILQVLLLRRNPELVFAGNNWVFPGGKVEADEIHRANGDLDIANRTAARRECLEETGLVIDEQSLVPISHWTTPDVMPKRFATQFFICLVAANQKVTVTRAKSSSICGCNQNRLLKGTNKATWP